MTRRAGELAVLVAVMAVWWGYYAVPRGTARDWTYYTAQGALIALAAWGAQRDRLKPQTFAGAWACVICMFEGGQQAVCGVLHGPAPAAADVCIDITGAQPYQALLSLSVSALIVRHLWRRNGAQPNTPAGR